MTFEVVSSLWIVCSLSTIGYVLLARRRRRLLARELHEVRGALTAAQLVVELGADVGDRGRADRLSACAELARTRDTLASFEQLLHQRLLGSLAVWDRGSRSSAHRGRAAAGRQAIAIGGGANVDPAPEFDAAAELERLADVWRRAAAQSGRELILNFDELEPVVHVSGPRRHFTQVVANLLGNALRHGDGRIEILVRAVGGQLRVEVSDQGTGLRRPLGRGAQQTLRSPFDRLGRGESLGRHGHGLHVAKASARQLGGSLRSAPSGAGARIVFTVPIVESLVVDDSGSPDLRVAAR
jgi:signal transduction histidine kinase